MYDTKKNFLTDQLKWQYPITGEFCPKGWAQAVNFFSYAFLGKEWNYLSPKNIQWTSKKTPFKYNALLLQFSAVFCLVILEFSDSFVRLKQNQQTDESD